MLRRLVRAAGRRPPRPQWRFAAGTPASRSKALKSVASMWVWDQCLIKHTDFDELSHAELDAVFHHSGDRGQRTPTASSQCLGDRYSRLQWATRRNADQVRWQKTVPVEMRCVTTCRAELGASATNASMAPTTLAATPRPAAVEYPYSDGGIMAELPRPSI